MSRNRNPHLNAGSTWTSHKSDCKPKPKHRVLTSQQNEFNVFTAKRKAEMCFLEWVKSFKCCSKVKHYFLDNLFISTSLHIFFPHHCFSLLEALFSPNHNTLTEKIFRNLECTDHELKQPKTTSTWMICVTCWVIVHWIILALWSFSEAFDSPLNKLKHSSQIHKRLRQLPFAGFLLIFNRFINVRIDK